MTLPVRPIALVALIALLAVHAPRSTALAQSAGPVLAFGFEEGAGVTAVDASGNGHAGTLAGPTWITTGRFGRALSFDGINDWVTVADAPLLDLTTGMTLEAWVYPTAAGPWRTAILKESPGGLAYALYGLGDGPIGNTYINVGGGDQSPPVSTAVPLNQWSHVAATYDGAMLRMYVNGVQAGATAVTGTILQTADALRVGGNAVWGEWFQGRIDEVRVYRRALTGFEIQQDMFVAVVPSDQTAPTVINRVPADGATNVPVATNVLAVFSEAMNATSIGTSTVVLRDGAAVVPAAVTYSGTTATLDPTNPLAPGRTYTVTVSGGAGGVRDLAGNPLAANVTWSFTTTSDATPPSVTSRSPSAGATNVATGVEVTATFSESITPHTLSFTLRSQGGSPVAATVTYDDPSRTARLRPTAPLAAATAYTASVQAADLVGNGMATVSWSFTTGTPGFVESVVMTGLVQPTAIEFASDGRVFVAEKRGVVNVFDSLADTTPTVVADLRTNVHNFWDRGLLGMALDPAFPARPFVYLLYTYDGAIGETAPRWGNAAADSDPCPTPPGATADGCVVSGRLTRIELAGNTMVGNEQVLVHDWPQQYPSHSIGSLMFGADGALYATGGDGASFNFVDYGQDGNPTNPFGDPPVAVGGIQTAPTAEGGALRSQDLRTSGDPVTLDGSVIRIHPDTGEAMGTNPLATHPDPNARRIVAYGLRNPFRFTIRPGTNELFVGDVGWSAWEEINRIPDGSDGVVENFGWPCYEGNGRHAGYDGANLTLCENLYNEGPSAVTAPLLPYPHRAPMMPGDNCANGSSSISGLAFYPGGAYPAQFDGALFFADYSRNCIWVMFRGADGQPDPATRTSFRPGAQGPVQLKIGPDGDLFYVNLAGAVHRVQYFDGNAPPTAHILATPAAGNAPLTVTFNGLGSSDPNGDPLAFAWDLDGDGAFDDSTAATPTFTYTSAGLYTVRLRVSDPQGLADVASIAITANNAPPAAVIDTPTPSLRWRVGQLIEFSGHGSDADEGTLPPSALRWDLLLHHCSLFNVCHVHTVQSFAGVASGSFVTPDHEYPSHLELTLTVTDSGGLSDIARMRLDPQTTDLTFHTQPSGLQLVVGSTAALAPFTRTVIVGSTNSITAPSPNVLGEGQSYTLVSWSDGGAATHNVVASEAGGTFLATYTPIPTMVISNATATEGPGATASFTVSLFTASLLTVTVDYTTVNSSAAAGADYAAQSGTISFPPGTTSQTVTIPILDDPFDENDELFLVRLSNPAYATIADGEGNGTIVDNDAMPLLTVDNVTVTEGNAGTVMAAFAVRLSTPSGRPVTFSFATANGTATAGSDYTATSGSMGIPAGSLNAIVNVPVIGDGLAETDETFVLDVSNVANAIVSDAQGTGTIVDDDVPGPTGLVAAWGFEEGTGTTAGDDSGNGVNGVISGAAWSTAGRFGRALSFDGVNDLVTVADRASLDLGVGMTISAWVRPAALSDWRTVLLKESPVGLAYALYAHDNGPWPASYVNAGSGDVAATGTTQLALDTWTHLATTYDGTNLRFYVGGNLVRTIAVGGAIQATAGALRIGGNQVWGEYFSGLIDEVRVYNRVQTQTEIQADMNRAVRP